MTLPILLRFHKSIGRLYRLPISSLRRRLASSNGFGFFLNILHVRKKTTTLPKILPAELELAFPRIWLTFFFFSVCWLTGNHSYFPALRSPTNLDEPNFRCPHAYNSLLSVSWPSQKKHNVIKIRGRSEIEWFIMVILLIMQRGWRKSWKVIIKDFPTITDFTPLWRFYCVLRCGILL